MTPNFYIIENDAYYPSSGMGDWSGPFTEEVAYEKAKECRSDTVAIVKVEDNVIKIIEYFR